MRNKKTAGFNKNKITTTPNTEINANRPIVYTVFLLSLIICSMGYYSLKTTRIVFFCI